MSRGTSDVLAWVIIITLIVAVLGGVIVGLCYFCPRYNIWASQMGGRAELAHAQFSRQVAVQEASAKLHSATLLAQAEVERAKGVAQANKIIGDSLKDNEGYLRYLWITGLESGTGRETVYIPTEAGLPILEANRYSKQLGR
jgi:regulator of protease activity HflC (stomatin/prohibitin superfamily)